MKFVRLAQPNQISTRKTGANSTIFWLSVTNSITNHTKFSGLKQQLFHFAKPYIIWILCGPLISVHCGITGTGWPGLGIPSMMVHPHGGSLLWLPAGNYAGALSQGPFFVPLPMDLTKGLFRLLRIRWFHSRDEHNSRCECKRKWELSVS